MANGTTHDPNEMLTPMECLELFCRKFKYGKDSYYKYHRDYIKFRPTGYEESENGQIVEKNPRIPYRIALGMINWLQGTYNQDRDPAMQIIMNYMANIPANAGQ
jgi:hypothetical protein